MLGIVNHVNSTYKVQAIFNYLNPDTFFLKALGKFFYKIYSIIIWLFQWEGLNGFSVGSTSGIYYGSTFQCVITTLDGDQKLSNSNNNFKLMIFGNKIS